MPRHLLAVSDLHVNRTQNLAAVRALPDHGDDWLILSGDIGDAPEHLELALDLLCPRFERLLWVPGNHELWVRPTDAPAGVARYAELVEVCQRRGVATPEDPPVTWTGPGGPAVIALCFVGWDLSFLPPHIRPEMALAWAAETGIYPVDHRLLRPDPHPDMPTWCRSRVALTERRLAALPDLTRVLVNHWPLRRDLVRIPLVPRYAPWCGTTLTADWHQRFGVDVVVSGHLHVRATDWRDGVRFEEVSLGYPQQWQETVGLEPYLRRILPSPFPTVADRAGPVFYR